MDITFLDNAELAWLKANWAIVPEDKQELVAALIAAGQTALFADWDAPGVNDDAKSAFLDSLVKINGNYPGGLTGYISNCPETIGRI